MGRFNTTCLTVPLDDSLEVLRINALLVSPKWKPKLNNNNYGEYLVNG